MFDRYDIVNETDLQAGWRSPPGSTGEVAQNWHNPRVQGPDM
jgi:hypothetical protein